MRASAQEGRVAVVTGAASGIGRPTALQLAAEWAAVLCADLNEAGASATAAEAGSTALAVRLDMTAETDWEEAIRRAVEFAGPISLLVNSAGVSAGAPLAEMALADWQWVLVVNLDGAFLVTKHALRAMRAGGGSVVHVGSASSVRAAAYSASKAGLCMLVKSAAKECRDGGWAVRVNAVWPAGVKTPMWSSMPSFRDLAQRLGSEEAAYASLASGPGERFAEPADLVAVILFLASDEARFVNRAEFRWTAATFCSGAVTTRRTRRCCRPGPHVRFPGFVAHSAAPAAELGRSPAF